MLTWTLTGPSEVSYIWRDGVKIAETQLTSWLVSVAPGESPVFELFDDAAAVPADAHPAYAVLGFYAAAATAEYRVQQFVSAAWTTVATLRDDGATPYFTWRSPPLADSTSHQFRVVPVGTNGNVGTAAPLTMLIVTWPAVPRVSYAYNGAATPTVTITAA